MNAANTSEQLINAMMQAAFYNHPVSRIELIETHISLVFLTGEFAYKVKKPVNFGFLDFSQLDRRKYFCEEELRLNGRLAPNIYLEVLPVTQFNGSLQLNGQGEIVEYAIRMRQFDAHGLLSTLIDENTVQLQHIDTLAERLASFHESIQISSSESSFGNAETVMVPVNQNFNILRSLLASDEQHQALDKLEQHSRTLHDALFDTLQQRKQTGHIKECHGDLHLGNIALSNDEIIIFDGIEFNDSFRWIDTMSDIAFLVMDLQDHQRNDYATHFLNHYLELSGDYAGLGVLQFYKLYRAMVRAKVAVLRMQQETPGTPEYTHTQQQLRNYLNLAQQYTQTPLPFIAITHGVSGSGKSWLAQKLSHSTASIIIRSDSERKRLFAASTKNLYTRDITNQVYEHLLLLTENIIHYGYAVIIDATFLERTQRQAFQQLASRLEMPFHILHCHADTDLLHQRIQQRQTDRHNISDANATVLEQQLQRDNSLDEKEDVFCIDINTSRDIDIHAISHKLIT